MTAAVWRQIIGKLVLMGIASAVAWAVGRGLIPAELQAQAIAGAVAMAAALGTVYLTARQKLESEARGQLPAGASWAEVEARMIAIGYGRLLFALRGKSDSRLDAVIDDVQKLKDRVDVLERQLAGVLVRSAFPPNREIKEGERSA